MMNLSKVPIIECKPCSVFYKFWYCELASDYEQIIHIKPKLKKILQKFFADMRSILNEISEKILINEDKELRTSISKLFLESISCLTIDIYITQKNSIRVEIKFEGSINYYYTMTLEKVVKQRDVIINNIVDRFEEIQLKNLFPI